MPKKGKKAKGGKAKKGGYVWLQLWTYQFLTEWSILVGVEFEANHFHYKLKLICIIQLHATLFCKVHFSQLQFPITRLGIWSRLQCSLSIAAKPISYYVNCDLYLLCQKSFFTCMCATWTCTKTWFQLGQWSKLLHSNRTHQTTK